MRRHQAFWTALSRRDLALLAGLVALSVAAFAGLCAWPAEQALRQQQAEYQKLQLEVETGRRQVKRLESLAGRVSDLARQVAEGEARLLGEAALPHLTADAEVLARRSRAQLVSVEPGKAEAKEGFARYPVALVLRGDSAGVEEFLYRLTSLPYAVRVESLELKQAAGGTETGRRGPFEVRLTVALFGPAQGGGKTSAP
ncbi:MAG: type 4a pilus biogenesis protein PilO [Bacillota bacterium]|nr:type 4a pilus biogenesis protein PilO [Bacillota bacterium]